MDRRGQDRREHHGVEPPVGARILVDPGKQPPQIEDRHARHPVQPRHHRRQRGAEAQEQHKRHAQIEDPKEPRLPRPEPQPHEASA